MASITFDFFELKDEYADSDSVKSMIQNENKDDQERYMVLYEKDPDEFSYLYQMKNNLKLQNGSKAEIGVVDGKMALLFSEQKEGQDQFYITAMRENKDGKLGGAILIKDEVAAKMKKDDMKQLVETIKDTGIDISTLDSSNEKLSGLLSEINDILGRGEISLIDLEDLERRGAKLSGDQAAKFKNAVKEMKKSLKDKLNARAGHEYVMRADKGYDVFELYGKDYSNLSSDAKKKAIPNVRIYVKQKSDGKASYQYHVKDNGGIDAKVAGAMIDAMKEVGFDSIDLSKVVKCDRKTFMIAAAENGLIPKGVYISPRLASNLLKAAQDGLKSESEVEKFKIQLALSMEEYNTANNKGGKDDEDLIGSLKSEYRNRPLKKAWEDGGLKRLLADHTRTSDHAEETLAAMYAMNKVLNVYKDFGSVKELLAMPVGAKTQKSPNIVIFDTEEEKKKVATLFAGREETKIRSVSAADMKLLFDRFMDYGMKKAEHDLLDIYEKNEREYTARQFDRTIILSLYNQRKNMLTSTTEELKSEGCDIALPTMNQPDTYPKGQAYARKIKEEIAAEKKRAEEAEKKNEQPAPATVIPQGRSSR